MKTATSRLCIKKKKPICPRKLQAIKTDEVINVARMAASKHGYRHGPKHWLCYKVDTTVGHRCVPILLGMLVFSHNPRQICQLAGRLEICPRCLCVQGGLLPKTRACPVASLATASARIECLFSRREKRKQENPAECYCGGPQGIVLSSPIVHQKNCWINLTLGAGLFAI